MTTTKTDPLQTFDAIVKLLTNVEDNVRALDGFLGGIVTEYARMQSGYRLRGVELSDRRNATEQARALTTRLAALLAENRAAVEMALRDVRERMRDGHA